MADIGSKELEEMEKEVFSQDVKLKRMEEFVSPESLYQELIASVKKYHPSTDITLIEKAYGIAKDFHEGQVRKSGEPYIIHPLCVAIILADLELDKETIVAGLLRYSYDRRGDCPGVQSRCSSVGGWSDQVRTALL